MSTLFDADEPEMTTKALAPWMGSNRMLAPIVGQELRGCEWVGVPFAGGMAEVFEIKARAILVNDLHKDIINLAMVVADDEDRAWLIAEADINPFHPEMLKRAQKFCTETYTDKMPDRYRAIAYFVAVWMGRSGKAGTDDEFKGNLSSRFTASGGGSNVRYRSAIASLDAFAVTLKRCEFSVLDFREFLEKCHDRKGHGLYCDAPFPGVGDGYKHKFTTKDHYDLAAKLATFYQTRVVIRYYDHQLIRELYPESRWTWRRLKGRDQANNPDKEEVLIINGPSYA